MTTDVQPPDPAGDLPVDPAGDLLDAARGVVPGWLRRITLTAGLGLNDPLFTDDVEAMVARASSELLADLAELLATDVDEQRTNPLSLFRSAVAAPTAVLRHHEVTPPRPDAFAAERFPGDPFRLGPATWSDVDPALHGPGLTWGAWKAMTVLRRRRDEGLR